MVNPRLSIRLADPSQLIAGHVNTRIRRGSSDIVIDDSIGVDPAILIPLRDLSLRALGSLVIGERISPLITVRFVLERDLPGLAHLDVSDTQVDFYLERSTMPFDVAEELASHVTHLTRRVLRRLSEGDW